MCDSEGHASQVLFTARPSKPAGIVTHLTQGDNSLFSDDHEEIRTLLSSSWTQ